MMPHSNLHTFRRRMHGAGGQTVLEMAMMLPLLVALALGLVELSSALFDQHVATKASREGANMISRDASLADAYAGLQAMATSPLNFSTRTKVIFSVIKQVSTTGAANYGQNVVYARLVAGAAGVGGGTAITCSCGTFGPAPDYIAPNSDNNTAFRVTGGVPAGALGLGGMLYVTEIWTTHTMLTPINRLGITVPSTIYSIAYF